MKTLLVIAALVFAAPSAFSATPDRAAYHVMYSKNGKSKCSNKASKEKADLCAGKLRAKGKAANVQVMAGKCHAR
jgi:hypothetical protein